MAATIERHRITAAELAEAEEQYAAVIRELNAAQWAAARATQEACDNWTSQMAARASHDAWATVRHLTEKANRLAAFLQSADVDPEPEPEPPAPAARPVGTIQRDPRVIVARHFGSCRHCTKGIMPGDRIVRTYVAGVWSHPECFERDIAARKTASDDRKLAGMFLSLFERMGVAA